MAGSRHAWWIGFGVYLIYNAIIYATWFAVDADYANLVPRDLIFKSVVLPLSLGAVFMFAAITWLGWWRPVMREKQRGGPGWTVWVLVLVMAGFIAVLVAHANWSAISTVHLTFLIAAGMLVGFNEESLTRGVLVVGWRGSTQSEVRVWFWTSALFGLMHLPNALFGLPLFAALAQTVFAFLAGSGFYLLRRVSGTIMIPMIMHGAWDFSTFSLQASGAELPAMGYAFQFGTYLVSIVLVIVVLRHDRRAGTAATRAEPRHSRIHT